MFYFSANLHRHCSPAVIFNNGDHLARLNSHNQGGDDLNQPIKIDLNHDFNRS